MMYLTKYSKEFEEVYYNHVIRNMNETFKESIVKLCNTFFPDQFKLKSIKDLILMSPDVISDLVKEMDISSKDIACFSYNKRVSKKDQVYLELDKVPTMKTIYNRYENYVVDVKYEKKMNIEIVKNSKILVCPYCNRNYINVRDKRMGGQLDHFYSRADFPFFSISLYNLVPSCTVCNNLKNKEEMLISPFSSWKYYEEVRFAYLFKSKKEIEIFLTTESENRKKDIEILQLKDAYEIHDVDIIEMLENEKKYTKEHRNKLKKLLKIDDLEIDKILFGKIVEERNLENIPLGKIKSDIYKEIKLKR